MRRARRGPGTALRAHIALVGAGCLTLVACRQALNTVLDVPMPVPAPAAQAPSVAGPNAAPPPSVIAAQPADTARPAIERHLHPDSIVARLPRDHAGNIDWVAAVRDSVIRPRETLPGQPVPTGPRFAFGFDFYFRGPDSSFDASFPHSTHTEWLACQQCHSRIFPYRDTKFTMADIFQGKYCAECHGKVSFPVLTGCERCHTRMQMPADRAKPELLGAIQLTRVKTDSGNAAGIDIEQLPPATFPHAPHRIRYRCKACHLTLFEPRKGANQVTMQLISERKACGVCHDGSTAFAAGFGACDRCHLPPAPPVAGQ